MKSRHSRPARWPVRTLRLKWRAHGRTCRTKVKARMLRPDQIAEAAGREDPSEPWRLSQYLREWDLCTDEGMPLPCENFIKERWLREPELFFAFRDALLRASNRFNYSFCGLRIRWARFKSLRGRPL